MLNEILLGGGIAIISGGVGFLISKKITSSQFDIYVEQAKAKAKAIENEAEMLLNRSNLKAQEIEMGARRNYEEATERAKRDLSDREEARQLYTWLVARLEEISSPSPYHERKLNDFRNKLANQEW